MSSYNIKYQLYISQNILPKIIKNVNKDIINNKNKLLETESMKLWIRAVTSRSVNPNQDENYESLEFLGDREQAAHLAAILIKRNPLATEEDITNAEKNTLSKIPLANYCDSIGLTEFIRTRFQTTLSTKEDVLEALTGVIRILGDKVFGLGIGSIFCYNFIESMYSSIKIEVDKGAKDIFNEIAAKLKWYDPKRTKGGILNKFGKEEEIRDLNTGTIVGHRLIYKLNQKAREWMIQNNKNITNKGVLADITSVTKKEVQELAAQKAVETLKNIYNLTWKNADEYKKSVDKDRITPAVLNRMFKEGYSELLIEQNYDDDATETYVQLIGKNKDKKSQILLTIIKGDKIPEQNFKQMVYNKYAEIGTYNNETIRIN